MVRTDKRTRLDRFLPWLLLVGGLVAVLASVILMIEKIHKLENPALVPVCDLSPILSCSSVTASSQAEAFGFPNPLLGIAGYAALATVGAGLLAGAKFKRWFWRSINIGLLLAVAFIHWLIFQSLYRIGALCLYCMVVWSVSIPMLWYVTLYNLDGGHWRLPKSLRRAGAFARRHHGDILLVWFLVIIALILKRFWYYWSTLI